MSIDRAKWDLTFKLGQAGEAEAGKLFDALTGNGSELAVEVKRDEKAHATGNVYVEFQQGGKGSWRPSGIATTKADVWVFVFPETGTMLAVPTELLKEEARKAHAAGSKGATSHTGDMPTRGALIPTRRLVPNGGKP